MCIFFPIYSLLVLLRARDKEPPSHGFLTGHRSVTAAALLRSSWSLSSFPPSPPLLRLARTHYYSISSALYSCTVIYVYGIRVKQVRSRVHIYTCTWIFLSMDAFCVCDMRLVREHTFLWLLQTLNVVGFLTFFFFFFCKSKV